MTPERFNDISRAGELRKLHSRMDVEPMTPNAPSPAWRFWQFDNGVLKSPYYPQHFPGKRAQALGPHGFSFVRGTEPFLKGLKVAHEVNETVHVWPLIVVGRVLPLGVIGRDPSAGDQQLFGDSVWRARAITITDLAAVNGHPTAVKQLQKRYRVPVRCLDGLDDLASRQ
ncbi:hypothetical protein JTZ10_10955 [Gordonia rubripertincta]|uniref:Uncharacterized protein n=1 Tax=Gordonia rubripertincta TaxID=36822 RepID=A0AAW4G570_GORRU|nr:hypothetical protein [Gordonia rubripertincta]MBM7278281.1 hypothetical protein [Gordonia rubripertincta]